MSDGKLSHEDISLLLPWYLNGTLEGNELDTVKRHLSQCAPCARDVKELNFIRSAVAESNERLNETLSVPVSEMEKNIMDRIGAFEDSRETGAVRHRSNERGSLWSKVAEFFDRFTVLSAIPAGAIALIVLQFALIIGLAAKLSFEKPEGYEILSGVTETDGRGPIIFIAFREDATEKEIRETLGRIGGRIVDGPKEGGLYIVDLPDEPDPGMTVDRVIEELRAKPEVVKSVFKGGD